MTVAVGTEIAKLCEGLVARAQIDAVAAALQQYAFDRIGGRGDRDGRIITKADTDAMVEAALARKPKA